MHEPMDTGLNIFETITTIVAVSIKRKARRVVTASRKSNRNRENQKNTEHLIRLRDTIRAVKN